MIALLPLLSVVLTVDAATAAGAAELLPAAAAALGVGPDRLTLQLLAAPKAGGAEAKLDVELGGATRRLVLTPRSLRADDFRVLAQGPDGTLREVAVPAPTTWRGRVEGAEGSRVLAGLVDGELQASVMLPAGPGAEAEWWLVTPARRLVSEAPASLYAVCREAEVTVAEGTCAAEDGTPAGASAPGGVDRLQKLAPAEVLDLELACDADFEFYTANGSSVANTVADIELVINGVADLYELDLQTTFSITTIIVREAEPDPYTTTNPTALLTQMQSEWRTNRSGVARDLAHLFTGRDLDGTTIGIGFSDPSVCSTYTGYSLAQSRYSTALANRIAISAHEIAHNCNGVHCDYMDYICRIMCPSLGRCSCAIHSFGPWEVSRIKPYLAGCACLGTVAIDFPHAVLPFSDGFPGINPDPAKWTAVDQVYVQYGRMELNHGGGYSPEFYLGTARTLPIVVSGRVDISYKARPVNVTAGQKLRVEYFDTATRAWSMLNEIAAPGGAPAYTTYAHTTPPEARGELFCLRFSAYGNTGNSSTDWHVDDVSIVPSLVDVPEVALASPLLRDVRPNPFNPRAQVTFACERERRVRVTVLDLAGAPVAVLADRLYGPGEHAVAWDGRDAAGRPMASGAYVVRLESEERSEARKVSLMK